MKCFCLQIFILLNFLIIYQNYSQSFKLGQVHLQIFGNNDFSKNLISKDIESFHRIFQSQVNRLYTQHNLNMPQFFKVLIFMNSQSFRTATNLPWYVAGIYNPVDDAFLFQNPGSLDRRGVLRKTIKHEICHKICNQARPISNVDLRWLEESYCEALSSDMQFCSRKFPDINEKITAMKNINGLISALNIPLKTRKKQLFSQCLAGFWGQHLFSEMGQTQFFTNLSTEIKPDQLAEMFLRFQQKFK